MKMVGYDLKLILWIGNWGGVADAEAVAVTESQVADPVLLLKLLLKDQSFCLCITVCVNHTLPKLCSLAFTTFLGCLSLIFCFYIR
jgi:hypothetical protein